MAWNWLGKSRTMIRGSVAPVLAKFLLNEADTRLPTRDPEQRKANMTSHQTINKAKQQRVQYAVIS